MTVPPGRSLRIASELPVPERAGAAQLRYGLVVWLRAESAEALAADLRALAADNGIGVAGLRTEEVVAEGLVDGGGRCAHAHTYTRARVRQAVDRLVDQSVDWAAPVPSGFEIILIC